jgi:hypothetical protein
MAPNALPAITPIIADSLYRVVFNNGGLATLFALSRA